MNLGSHLKFPIILSAVLFFLGEGIVEAQRFREYKVKAVYLYNFINFVKWPEDAFKGPKDPITIAILGKNPFSDDLENLASKGTLNGRKFQVKYFEGLDDLDDCHVLFVRNSEKKNLKKLFKFIQAKSILTVGESKEFCEKGGIINLYRKNKKIRLEINHDAAKRIRLKISSRLLHISKIVADKKP